jgi:O-antigen ligase
MGVVAMALMDHLKDIRARLGLAVLLVVLLTCLLYTQSRASYLALIPAYLVFSILSRHRFYLLAGLILALILSPIILPQAVKERIAYTFAQPKRAEQIRVGPMQLDTSTSARLRGWKKGLQTWQKRPFLGHGVTGYGFMDAQYPRSLVETGIVGILAFAWLIYALFRVAISEWREQQDDLLRGLSVGLTAGLAGLLVHALGANTFIIVRIMEPFWFLTGIVIALSSINEDGPQEPAGDSSWLRSTRNTR